MLLRSSSSTPSVQPFSEGPSRGFDSNTHYINNCPLPLHLRSLSANSSPISRSASGFSEFNQKPRNLPYKAFRKSRSDGNLQGLASTSFDPEEYRNHLKFSVSYINKEVKPMLHSAPSFSIYTSNDGEFECGIENRSGLERSATIGERIEGMGSGELSFGKKGMHLIEENDDDEEVLNDEFQNLGIEDEVQPVSPRMYLATGLGIEGNCIGGLGLGRGGCGSGGGGGGGGDFTPAGFDEGGNVEEYYKKMVGEDPSNPLFLRTYAQLLESKGDLPGAEEYYLRATSADPKDGEILMLYAKLVWKLHHDQDRALGYFEWAAQAAPENSHVLAAYASFLWEIEENEEADFMGTDHTPIEDEEGFDRLQKSAFGEDKELVKPSLCLATGLGMGGTDCTTAVAGQGANIEDYYRRMIEENPFSPLFMRNYAQFLYETKGDMEEAEKYYSRAMLADPGDGAIISEYAKLVWKIHHDQDKALSYFERSVQATPENCHVLAAYASFLWETEEDKEEDCVGELTLKGHL